MAVYIQAPKTHRPGSNLPLPSWVTLGKHFCFSEPQFANQISLFVVTCWAVVRITRSHVGDAWLRVSAQELVAC